MNMHTMEIPAELYEELLLLVERQESSLEFVVKEALEVYLLAEDYIENDNINGEGKTWDEILDTNGHD